MSQTPVTPLTGNAVATGAVVTSAVTLFFQVLSMQGIVVPLEVQSAATIVITAVVAWVVRSQVYSQLSMKEITGRAMPAVVPATPEARAVAREEANIMGEEHYP